MNTNIRNAFRAKRRALALTQAEVARRSGIEQRQVSHFERGGDITISTLLKLAQALEIELVPVPRNEVARVQSLIASKSSPPATIERPPSLLELYQVKDDEDASNA
jgi:transcriptional regulator with XRE-family HTH domain